MKVKDLIHKLSLVNPENTVYLIDGDTAYDFTFVGYDDVGDVELGRASGDKEA
ncbi:hypothetical protein LCGC14_0926640 [marine sediment metagenome]|uniref:Uncharacterized protein n=1 Tax=marine sediment metagenome TaxID=412755 RepID=A0A0F9PA46_9ZZZZ